MLSAALLHLTLSGAVAHEGFREHPYKDRNGISVGYGYSLTKNPLHLSKAQLRKLSKGITKKEAEQLTAQVLTKLDTELSDMAWYTGLNTKERYVTLDMAYNLGINGVSKFKRALHYIGSNNDRAAKELLNSKWARQVGSRATDLAATLRNS